MANVVLASASARRRLWLSKKLNGHEVRLEFIELDEEEPSPIYGKEVRRQVEESCLYKAMAASRVGFPSCDSQRIVIVSDTLVQDPDDELCALGKPADEISATSMLIRLSGRRHVVWSSTALMEIGRGDVALEEGWRTTLWTDFSIVEFEELKEEWLEKMIREESWLGKAGGYDLAGIAEEVTRVVEGEEVTVLGFSNRSMDELALRIF